MKTFKFLGNYVKPLLATTQGLMVAGIGYLVANPHALDDTPLPDSWRTPIAVFLGIAASVINSRHSQTVVGSPIVGRRAADAKLTDVPAPNTNLGTSSEDNPTGVAG